MIGCCVDEQEVAVLSTNGTGFKDPVTFKCHVSSAARQYGKALFAAFASMSLRIWLLWLKHCMRRVCGCICAHLHSAQLVGLHFLCVCLLSAACGVGL
jgi:hypothetical protein